MFCSHSFFSSFLTFSQFLQTLQKNYHIRAQSAAEKLPQKVSFLLHVAVSFFESLSFLPLGISRC